MADLEITDRPHVFVLRGDLTELACDEVLIPCDRHLQVHRGFEPLLAMHPGRGSYRTAAVAGGVTWRDGGERVLEADRRAGIGVWLVNTGGNDETELPWLLHGVSEAFRRATADPREPKRNRSRRLIALPLVGTGAGGYQHRRGDVVKALLARLHELALVHEVDVALVLDRADDYAAVQATRRRMQAEQNDGPWQEKAHLLAARIARGEVVLFAGAGLSVAAGLPDWWTLVRSLAEQAPLKPDVMARLRELSPADAAQLVEQAMGRDLVRSSIKAQVQQKWYGLGHGLLANLGVDEVLTTNYDVLYEQAYRAAGSPSGELRVLPRQTAMPGAPWLLKMHGDVVDDDHVVLSRGDYLDYDARHRPLASMVQALLMTRHMVFVGFSLVDENFVRLAHDVQALMGSAAGARPVGTVLSLLPDPLRQSLWAGQLNFDVLDSPGEPHSTGSQGPEARLRRNARRLEVFLDQVGMAVPRIPAYLLDPAYVDMLDDSDRRLVKLLEPLQKSVATVEVSGDAAERVAELLRGFGGRTAQLTGPSNPATDTAAGAPDVVLPLLDGQCPGCGTAVAPRTGQGMAECVRCGQRLNWDDHSWTTLPYPVAIGTSPPAVATRLRRAWLVRLLPRLQNQFAEHAATLRETELSVNALRYIRTRLPVDDSASPADVKSLTDAIEQAVTAADGAVRGLIVARDTDSGWREGPGDAIRPGDPHPVEWPALTDQLLHRLKVLDAVQPLSIVAVSQARVWIGSEQLQLDQLQADRRATESLRSAVRQWHPRLAYSLVPTASIA